MCYLNSRSCGASCSTYRAHLHNINKIFCLLLRAFANCTFFVSISFAEEMAKLEQYHSQLSSKYEKNTIR